MVNYKVLCIYQGDPMKLSRKKTIKWNYLALAFAIPVVGMLFVMLISQYEPFGKYSMLYSDMYHQYYPFFVEFRRAILSGDGLMYTWSVGLGMDYLGLIAYYLASPLNLLSLLVPEGILLEFFSLLVPLKLGLASLFFALLLKKLFGREDFSLSLFGAWYGLCAWALGYQWNIMWLDSFALLPLVILGMVSLLREKKFILYTLALALAIAANYYIGLFVCIFVFLLFFVYEICRGQGGKRFFGDLFRIACFSLLAIGMTAILELPAFAALQTTQSSVNNFPDTFRLNIADENTLWGLLDAMRQVAGNMGAVIDPTFKEGLPNLYCGVGSLLLAVLYLTAREVKLRDKVCAVFLLLFFNVSFIIRQLDYIWHGFHFTNMIPYRFSFLHSFVVLYMAYRAWLLRKSFRWWQIAGAGLITGALLACSNELMETETLELGSLSLDVPVYLVANTLFLLLYLVGLFYGAKRIPIPEDAEPEEEDSIRETLAARFSWVRNWWCSMVCLELVVALVVFGLSFTGTSVKNYPKGTTHAASVIRYMHEREEDTLFYRAETTHSQTLNDGALNGYRGVTAFTSSANVKTTEFMKALGYSAKNTYNRYLFEESSPVSNLFLGLKYMIDRDDKDRSSTYFEEINHYGSVTLLQNNAYLPLGFLAEKDLGQLEFGSSAGTFQFQNSLFYAATGVESVFHYLQGEALTITGNNVTITTQNSSGYCDYEDCGSGANVTYSYVVDRDGFMCIHLNLPKRNDYYVSVNGVELYKETISLAQMIAVGDVKSGDVVDIRIACDQDENSTMTLSAAILQEDRFRRGYDILNASTLELTEFESTYVEGVIDCNRDGLLYTSIPQNGNWSAMVDGKPAQIRLVGDCMVAVELQQGRHTVSFTYENKAFDLGWKISLVCVAVFGLLVWLSDPGMRGTRKKGKYQK